MKIPPEPGNIEELRAASRAKQAALKPAVQSLGEPARPVTRKLPRWPGEGLVTHKPPARPRHGAHAEVVMAGRNTAIVHVTWPGGSTTCTIRNLRDIRQAMEWSDAFNEISGQL
jgi:hypothetical protein